LSKLKRSLKIDHRYTKKKEKIFLVKLMQNLALALLDTSSYKFAENLVEIVSNPRKDHQMAYKLQKNI